MLDEQQRPHRVDAKALEATRLADLPWALLRVEDPRDSAGEVQMVRFGGEQLGSAAGRGLDGRLVGDVAGDDGEAPRELVVAGQVGQEAGLGGRGVAAGRGQDGDRGRAEEVPGQGVAYSAAGGADEGPGQGHSCLVWRCCGRVSHVMCWAITLNDTYTQQGCRW